MGAKLEAGILNAANTYGHTIQLNRVGGALTVFFYDQPVIDYAGAQQADSKKFGDFYRLMLNEGIYLAPSKYEAWFLTTSHSNADIEKTIAAVEQSFKKLPV
jgi:glutamate-1-semialdehyde 2,1-aminomutase